MKTTLSALTVIFILIAACDSGTKNHVGITDSIVPDRSPKKTEVSDTIITKDRSGCYTMLIKKDTARLRLVTNGDEVSGDLSYHWFEKDHNDGTIKGKILDSLIVADYTFQSEGMTSFRQVVFKIKGDSLYQGYGEQRVRNDTSMFRDIRLVIFDTKHPFVKGCQ